MKITYFVEVISSWCYWAEPAWAELKKRYDGRVEFVWKIALMRPENFPISREQCEWFYGRSGTVMRSPFMLNTGWFELERKGHYQMPNLVAECGRDFGFHDDRLRLALTYAAVREGRKIGNLEEAISIAASATDIDPAKIRKSAESSEVAKRVETSTAEFQSYNISQRPAFVLENNIGDKAIFSGLVRAEPIAATIDAMLSDAAAYATHRAHFGVPPKT